MTKILKATITGTFSNEVDVWLEDDELEEMDDDDKKEALIDAWQYVEYEDIEVDESSIEISTVGPMKKFDAGGTP